MATRRRCTECRCVFTPSPRAQSTQRVCGPECRAARDRKLARARRRREVDAYRADERGRQQERRAAQAARAAEVRAGQAEAATPDAAQARAVTAGGGCHAPPSASNPSESLDEIVRFVDRRLEVSRASLLRALRRKWPSQRGGRGEGQASVTRQLPRPSA
jgi:hypothetical protein